MQNTHLYQSLDTVLRQIQTRDSRSKPKTVVVVGACWGDEGKGKIVDLLAELYGIGVRYFGGRNAGHTVCTDDGQEIVYHLMPCVREKESVIAAGVLFEIEAFVKEYQNVSDVLGKPPTVYIDPKAPLWTPWHKQLETRIEQARPVPLGTTGKAMGSIAGLRSMRLGPRVGDLFRGRDALITELKVVYDVFLASLAELGEIVKTPEDIADELLKYAPIIADMVIDTSFFLSKAISRGESVLFEGAQALGLDLLQGTYPFVSPGFSTAAGAAVGTGLPMSAFEATIMVTKILPTRVGAGPFPSEIWDREKAEKFAKAPENKELFRDGKARQKFLKTGLDIINRGIEDPQQISTYFQVLGYELGATTGRGRSVGWTDIPWLTYAKRINDPNCLALTRLDMLDGVESIPVVVGYKFKDQTLPTGMIPPDYQLDQVSTIIQEWECWHGDNIAGCRDWNSLPAAAQSFIEKLEDRLDLPIPIIGTGPKRSDIVVRPI